MVGILRLVLLLTVGSAFAAENLNGHTRLAAMSVGKDHIMLQASATVAKSETESAFVETDSAESDLKLQQRQETCEAMSQGTCSATPASSETKGTSRIQLKTTVSKVVLDLSEDDY